MAESSRKRPPNSDRNDERNATRARPNGIEIGNGVNGADEVDMALLEAAEREAGRGVRKSRQSSVNLGFCGDLGLPSCLPCIAG